MEWKFGIDYFIGFLMLQTQFTSGLQQKNQTRDMDYEKETGSLAPFPIFQIISQSPTLAP